MRFKDVHAGAMVSLSTIRPCFTNLKSDFLILLEDADADFVGWHPEILRVNRQIYSELVALLYSNLDVFVGIEDVECLIDDE
jgi:hypothetical protein